MKRIVNRLLCGLALVGAAWPALAVTSEAGGNPYLVVAERNAFDLKPIAPPPDPNVPPPQPPTKITLQGITVLFGKKQVLLKIPVPPEPGKPPERAITLDEGERRGSLEVVRIDPATREVEFKDSGNLVKLSLTNFITKTPAAAPGTIPPPGMPTLPGVPRPGIPLAPTMPSLPAPNPNVGVPAFGGASPTPAPYPTRTLRTTPPAGTPVLGGAGGVVPNATAKPQVQLTPEEQIVLMEIERERNKNNPNYPPLPPTELTPAPGK